MKVFFHSSLVKKYMGGQVHETTWGEGHGFVPNIEGTEKCSRYSVWSLRRGNRLLKLGVALGCVVLRFSCPWALFSYLGFMAF